MNQNITNHFAIPSRFRRVILLHIIKNYLPQENFMVPLLLGIHGPSGEGKTFQCDQVLREIDAKLFLISGGQLESHDAGEPARLIRASYLDAGRSIEKGESKVAVVVINDVDTGLGNWGDMVQYTINRQTVFGELMHLVDYPTAVEGRTTRRIPLIITGNDFTKMYAPLVRAGRMTAFEWVPTNEEKASIVARIFPDIGYDQCRRLIEELESAAKKLSPENALPVAAYSHLRATLSDDHIWGEIEKLGAAKVIDLISRGSLPRINPSVRLGDLMAAGKALIHSGRLVNHLGVNHSGKAK